MHTDMIITFHPLTQPLLFPTMIYISLILILYFVTYSTVISFLTICGKKNKKGMQQKVGAKGKGKIVEMSRDSKQKSSALTESKQSKKQSESMARKPNKNIKKSQYAASSGEPAAEEDEDQWEYIEVDWQTEDDQTEEAANVSKTASIRGAQKTENSMSTKTKTPKQTKVDKVDEGSDQSNSMDDSGQNIKKPVELKQHVKQVNPPPAQRQKQDPIPIAPAAAPPPRPPPQKAKEADPFAPNYQTMADFKSVIFDPAANQNQPKPKNLQRVKTMSHFKDQLFEEQPQLAPAGVIRQNDDIMQQNPQPLPSLPAPIPPPPQGQKEADPFAPNYQTMAEFKSALFDNKEAVPHKPVFAAPSPAPPPPTKQKEADPFAPNYQTMADFKSALLDGGVEHKKIQLQKQPQQKQAPIAKEKVADPFAPNYQTMANFKSALFDDGGPKNVQKQAPQKVVKAKEADPFAPNYQTMAHFKSAIFEQEAAAAAAGGNGAGGRGGNGGGGGGGKGAAAKPQQPAAKMADPYAPNYQTMADFRSAMLDDQKQAPKFPPQKQQPAVAPPKKEADPFAPNYQTLANFKSALFDR